MLKSTLRTFNGFSRKFANTYSCSGRNWEKGYLFKLVIGDELAVPYASMFLCVGPRYFVK